MATQAAASKKQQGLYALAPVSRHVCFARLTALPDLQLQYSTYKNTIQQLAQKIGDVEQEKDEHMCVFPHEFIDSCAPSEKPLHSTRQEVSNIELPFEADS